MRTLLLFDIDGTLLSGATRAHSEALRQALRNVHGIDPDGLSEPPSPAGRTDGEIARLILLSAGVSEPEIDRAVEAVRDECCRIYLSGAREDLTHTVLPGVRELLEALGGRDDVILSLLTGNFEPVARRKLSQAGLGEFFPPGQGAFGSDSEARADLPAVARRRAGAGGGSHPASRTLVIGDTPRDIACARADGVQCVALATGRFSVEELRDADLALPDARDLHRRLEDILPA